MIPKIIHYCWFGRNPLPESAVKCLNSWREFLPDYEIKEWNEDNFDIDMIPYTREAYESKKYAFVSDYARFWILYHHGGLYFDTDVEIIKSFDDIIKNNPFMGIEVESTAGKYPLVNPGLGLGAPQGLSIYKEILDYYKSLHFIFKDGTLNLVTVVIHTTNILISHGLKQNNEPQIVDGICIYPKDYFNPFDDTTGILTITDNTRSIHWYSKTWLKNRNRFITCFLRFMHRYLGNNCFTWLKNICNN